ncbi:MAG: universal stress protein [candidate division WOR-3 bacterium]
MFRKILVATDLSPASEQLINHISGLSTLGTKEIVLLFCLNIRDVGSLAEMLSQLIKPGLEKQSRALADQGFAVTAEIRLGLPAIEINRTAGEKQCGLIVIGSHGYNLSKEILLGGVATAVLHSATKPVIVIKMKPALTPKDKAWYPLEHILYPTDFSDNAEAAFLYLEQLIRLGAKKVTLLHIQDQILGRHLKDRLDEFNQIDTERLERLRDRLLTKGKPDIEIEIHLGIVAEEILKRITDNDITLVVMGTQGRGHIGEMFLGSVSNKVVRRSPVPILLVPLVR